MDYLQKIQFAANSYYNRGLEMAKERDLSGAALYLKRALQFNKYHTDARNLLGLIFYEMGETSDALTQWVISINLQPENNRADHYLDEVQRKPGQLEIASQTIKKYNQALFHAQGGSDDLAVLQLKRIVEEKPNFVKAHLLLALLYMEHGDHTKAGKSLFKVLQIDKTNQKAQRYMEYVKSRTGKADVEKRKMKNAFSHREMQDDDVILPPTYKENTGWQSIINIAIGLVLGAVLVVWPDRSVRLMCTLLGAALLICGLVYILGWLVRRREGGISAFTLIPGVVLSGLGIWLMTSSDSVIALVQYVFGAVVIFHGVLDVQSSVSLMRQGAARWWLDLALSALTLALGALILINPFGTFAALVTLIGLVLIYDGLSDLWIIHRLSRMVRDLERDLNGDIIETRGRDLDE